MEEKQETNQSDFEQRNQKYEALKKFFTSDMKIKEELLRLAPTEIDDSSERDRMKYSDKLYRSLKDLEIEFIDTIQSILGNDSSVAQTIKMHFSKAREAFLIGHYDKGVIQKLYKQELANMNTKFIEEVKGAFVGYKDKEDLTQMVKKSGSVNELLHVMHSYVVNNEDLLQDLPVLETKTNAEDYSITLYGEETELSRRLFDQIPEDMDIGWTEIVSMPDKIIMMVRDRGHALTVDIDTSNKNDIAVKYFVPKICNYKMVQALPGINKSGISDNGATGFFMTSQEDMANMLLDFIERVPMDKDIERIDRDETVGSVRDNEAKNETDQVYKSATEERELFFTEQDAQELAMEISEKGTRIGSVQSVQSKLRTEKENIKRVFEGEKDDDRENGD